MRFLSLALLALPAFVAARPHHRSRSINGTHNSQHHKRTCTTKTSAPVSSPTGFTTTPASTSTDSTSVTTISTVIQSTSEATTPTATETTSEATSTGGPYTLVRGFPSEGVRGVNLGSLFVIEPWMMEDDWKSMGGQCDSCGACDISTEWDLVQALGQDEADSRFATHWANFLPQSDVELMKSYNLNSVRIPLGFWIIEETVNSDEFYPRGGLDALRKICGWFAEANMTVLLDLHAAPGGSTANNAFAGRCVDPPQFWGNEDNVSRHIKAGSKLAEIVHSEPEHFRTVWGIEALNEPPQDGSQTPGYFNFMTDFAAGIRTTESSLKVAEENRLQVTFMDVSWQYTNNAGNPAFAENGGSAYDSHMYLSFGGVTAAGNTVDEHIAYACSGDGGKIASNKAQFNTPNFRGEFWLLGVNTDVLPNDDIDNIKRWGDAQKMGYSPEGGQGGFGWYFWSWKLTNGDSGGWTHMRSYKDAVAGGYMHQDAAQYFDPNICQNT